VEFLGILSAGLRAAGLRTIGRTPAFFVAGVFREGMRRSDAEETNSVLEPADESRAQRQQRTLSESETQIRLG
jgi:hypothetical protein